MVHQIFSMVGNEKYTGQNFLIEIEVFLALPQLATCNSNSPDLKYSNVLIDSHLGVRYNYSIML